VTVAALQVTPPAQALLAHAIVHVVPLHVTGFAQEFLPEQVTELPLAEVVMPPEQEPPPLHVIPH